MCITKYGIYLTLFEVWGRRMVGISGSLTWSKILMELIFYFDEVRRAQLAKTTPLTSTLPVDAPGIFSDVLRSL